MDIVQVSNTAKSVLNDNEYAKLMKHINNRDLSTARIFIEDKIDEIIDMCNEINQINQQRGQGFNVGRRLPNVPNFQQRLNQAAAEHGFDGQEWEEDDGVNQGPDPDQAEFKE